MATCQQESRGGGPWKRDKEGIAYVLGLSMGWSDTMR